MLSWITSKYGPWCTRLLNPWIDLDLNNIIVHPHNIPTKNEYPRKGEIQGES
jgi:hypothetical protein